MRSVIFIDRNNLYYYGGNVHTIITMPFSKTAFSDLEILDEDELQKQITDWVKTQKIEPTTAIMVFPPSCYFQKEIPVNTPPDQIEKIKKDFITNIPFNEILTHEFTFEKMSLLTVINKRMAYTFRDIFHELHFKIEAIAPTACMYGTQTITSFNAAIAQDSIKKISSDTSFSLDEIDTVAMPNSYEPHVQTQNNNRLYVMLGVFGLLILILIVLFYMRSRPVKRKIIKITPEPLQQSISPSLATTSATISPSVTTVSSLLKQDMTIQVLNGSGVAGQADEIKTRLEEKQFQNIETGNAPTLQTAKTLVIFKPEVGEKERKEIINIVEFFVDEVSVQEKKDISTDILITTSKPANTTNP